MGYGVDEARRRCNRSGRLGRRNRRGGGAYGIVGARLELISGAEESYEVAPDAGLGSGQPGKFAACASMRPCHLAGLLENVSLGGVEYRKVCLARGDMGQGQCGNLPGVGKRGAGLRQIVAVSAFIDRDRPYVARA